MRILVDLDDVVVELMEKSIYYYNNRYDTQLQKEDLKEWELADRERWMDIWRIPDFFGSLRFVPGAEQGLLDLSVRHEIVIVTSFPTWEAARSKIHWVHTHLLIPGIIPSMDKLVLCRDKSLVKGDVLIDDRMDNLKTFEGEKICFAQPWNTEWRGEFRCRNWSEVGSVVQLLSKPPILSYYSGGCY